MPDKETKDVQKLREQEAQKGKLERVSAPDAPSGADDLTKSALQHQQQQEATKASANAINDAYYSPIQQTTNIVSGLVNARNNAKAQDETAQRKARSMQMVAGISDSLSSLANLIGVGQGGTHIDLGGGASTPLAEKMEKARLERKADIKSIDDRLDQYRNQLLQLQLSKGTAVAQAEQRASDAAREQARFDIEMAFKKGRAQVGDNQWQQNFDASQASATADRMLRQNQIRNDYNLRIRQMNQVAEQAGLKGSFPVLIGENEMLDIPKNEINNATIGRIFEQLPKEFKDLAQGKPLYQYQDDGMGGSVKVFAGYEQPTLDQKLAAVGAASRTDKTIQDELRKLAGTYKPKQKTEQVAQSVSDDDDDFSSYKVTTTPVSMSYKDNLPGGVTIPLGI